jgi:hypothetical protein
MTLIAFSATKNRADFLTDTWAYSSGGRRIGNDSKVHSIPHLDMAYAIQGDLEFGVAWGCYAAGLTMFAGSFDNFACEAGPYVRAAWDSLATPPQDPSTLFLIGYSSEASRFRAYQFDSDSDFERQDLEAPFIIPTPTDTRISDLEWARLEGQLRLFRMSDQQVLAAHDLWRGRPELVAPTTVKGWVQLGKHVRESRALVNPATGLKVFVAGDLFHTVVKRGEFTTSRVHRFNDSGAEFAQLVAGTLHPVSQYGPCCYCDSGRPYVDCCAASYATQPCPCGSGKPFQACCSVRAETGSPNMASMSA